MKQTVFKHINSGKLYFAEPGSDRERNLSWNLVNEAGTVGFLVLVEDKPPTSGDRTRDLPEEPDVAEGS